MGAEDIPAHPGPPEDPALSTEFVEAIEDFLEALRVEAGLSPHTLAAYRADVERFGAWSLERGVGALAGVDAEHVVDYLDRCRRDGLAEASTARRLSAIRMWLRHLYSEGRLPGDPLARLAAPVLRRSLPGTLSVEEVERLLGAPRGEGPLDQRDRAFLEVLYASGARVSEVVGLTTDGIEPELRVLVVTGKGRKTRVVPIGERARRALEHWLGDGRARLLRGATTRAVFVTRSGRALDRTNGWRVVKKAALAAGLVVDVSPHTLRHSFASHMIEAGADLRSVQEMLGHASIRTTEIYTHLDSAHVRSLHRLYHPRG